MYNPPESDDSAMMQPASAPATAPQFEHTCDLRLQKEGIQQGGSMWCSHVVKLCTHRLFGGGSPFRHRCMHRGSFTSPVHVAPCKAQMREGWDMLSLEEALTSLEQTVGPPSIESCICILQKCRKEKNLAYAKRVHKHIYDNELEADRTLGSYIVAMFAECGSMVDAQQVFDQLIHRNDYSWMSLLQGYNNCGESRRALDLLPKLRDDCAYPSSFTYQALLKACATLKCVEEGQEVHADLAKEGFERDSFIGSILLDMYVKCGLLAEAREVFDELPERDVVLWTALIAGYADHGFGEEAMRCLVQMRQEGVSPNPVTFICGLKGCGRIGRGQDMHIEIVKMGFEGDPFLGNTLVDMYAKCGSLAEARQVFAELPIRSTVSWTALVTGHVEHGASEEALDFFEQMHQEGIVTDAFMFACSLKACGNVGAIDRGRQMHAQIAKRGFETELFVSNALVDLYAKCGLLAEAQEVFNKLPLQDVVLWSALIAGYAYQGETTIVFKFFETMIREGIRPDRVVFLSVLTVCAHAGLVDIGGLYFGAMREVYGISQTIEHHNCMIDLLSRAGQLHEAVVMLEVMPVQPNLVTWVTLLGACRNWGNAELGRDAFQYAGKLRKKHSGSFLLAMQMLSCGQI